MSFFFNKILIIDKPQKCQQRLQRSQHNQCFLFFDKFSDTYYKVRTSNRSLLKIDLSFMRLL